MGKTGKAYNINNAFKYISSKYFNLVYLLISTKRISLTTDWDVIFQDVSMMSNRAIFSPVTRTLKCRHQLQRESAKSRDLSSKKTAAHVATSQRKQGDSQPGKAPAAQKHHQDLYVNVQVKVQMFFLCSDAYCPTDNQTPLHWHVWKRK